MATGCHTLKHKPLFLDKGADKAENYPHRDENQIFPRKEADFCNFHTRLNKRAHKDLPIHEDNLSRDHHSQRRMDSLLPGSGMPRLRKSQLPYVSQKEAHSLNYKYLSYPPLVPPGWPSGLCPGCFHFLPSLWSTKFLKVLQNHNGGKTATEIIWGLEKKLHGDKFKEFSLGYMLKGWDMSRLQHIGTITRVRYWGISWSANENKSFYQETVWHNLSLAAV